MQPDTKRMDMTFSRAILFSLILTKASALTNSHIAVSSPDYCYNPYRWCGPKYWQATFQYCTSDFMESQSPVILNPFHMMRNRSMGPLELLAYDVLQSEPWIIKNIRDTIAVEFNPGMYLGGANLPRSYYTFYMAFHWGSETTNGSEHIYNDRRYPMEMQIFHLVPPYQTLNEAAFTERQAVAVLAVFVDIGPEDNPVFETISRAVPTIPLAGDEKFIDPFPLRDLLPNDTSKFYQYTGSLTFPECLYAVEWIVFQEPIYISQKQYNRFIGTVYHHEPEEGEEPRLLLQNYRPTQALFDRILIASANAAVPMFSSSHSLVASLLAVLLTSLVSLLLPRMT
ncbi:receptor-type tyrosine-protein phosphatase gamma-like [Alosa sapidissima]|uniref:receptor-type tyrosine-protein phosphatase gamma-like n=1 Tax=Alosa sapidissima TaxID=34773 RepID=UPI001C099F3C|nr:receptor-type tyrosine-protein phosphatase gamma-like [Alosa sapidissima]XP_041952552.1 receptor-type tyrosine-protein phosphatase gamma-like [Alosa sapidissima]